MFDDRLSKKAPVDVHEYYKYVSLIDLKRRKNKCSYQSHVYDPIRIFGTIQPGHLTKRPFLLAVEIHGLYDRVP